MLYIDDILLHAVSFREFQDLTRSLSLNYSFEMGEVEKAIRLRRDDCESARQRSDGLSCVFAKIVSLNPFEIEDSTGRITFENVPCGVYELMDYGYFLLDTTVRPMRCVRLTVVPVEVAPVAACQLEISRNRTNQA